MSVDQVRENGMEDVRQRVRELAGEGLTALEIRDRLDSGLNDGEREIVRLLASREVKRHAAPARTLNGGFATHFEPQPTVVPEPPDMAPPVDRGDPAGDTRDRRLTAAAIIGVGGLAMLASTIFGSVALSVLGLVVLFAGLAAAALAN